MAQVKKDQGDLAGALALLEESLRIGKAALGDAHPEVAVTLGTMAQVKTSPARSRCWRSRCASARPRSATRIQAPWPR